MLIQINVNTLFIFCQYICGNLCKILTVNACADEDCEEVRGRRRKIVRFTARHAPIAPCPRRRRRGAQERKCRARFDLARSLRINDVCCNNTRPLPNAALATVPSQTFCTARIFGSFAIFDARGNLRLNADCNGAKLYRIGSRSDICFGFGAL